MATQPYRRVAEDSDDEELGKGGEPKEVEPRWNRFQEQPPPNETLAYEDKKFYQLSIRVLKVVTYIVVFIIVLGSAVLAKMTLFLMISQLKHNTTRPICFQTNRHREVEISLLERIQWTWAIFFCFLVPEVLSFGRSIRMLIFKRVESFNEDNRTAEEIEAERLLQKKRRWLEFVVATFFEICHVIGLGLFTFCVLPQVHAVKGSMLGNAVCLLPAFLGMLSRYRAEGGRRGMMSIVFMVLDGLAIVAQVWGIILWPFVLATNEMEESWLLPVSALLISFGWWENFVSTKSDIGIIQALARIRIGIGQNRYLYYSVISVLKMATFLGVMCLSVSIMGDKPSDYFTDFADAFNTTILNATEKGQTLAEGIAVTPTKPGPIELLPRVIQIENSYTAVQYALIAQILAAYLCYITAKFACKICIQEFSFALPVTLSVPVTIAILVSFCGSRMENVCFARSMLPDYLFWNCPAGDFSKEFLSNEHGWVWILLLVSQMWITLHIWFPKSSPLAHTEVLFCSPMYNAILTDQDLALNRKQEADDPREIRDANEEKKKKKRKSTVTSDSDIFEFRSRSDSKEDEEGHPRIYACATMWHETAEEMVTMFKSVLRMDAHQCCMRLVRNYFEIPVRGYFEFETHIYFDDAFTPIFDEHEKFTGDYKINSYVRDMIPAVEEAAAQVHETNMKIKAPKVIPTPYGGRMEWVLPGKTRLIVHLKNKDKIRHRKRWSQCMYMYYLLGFLLMDNDQLDNEQKEMRGKNTYLLALDGDIDFQPSAVERVLDLMIKDDKIGAVCGRIHPVGSGPLVWYQKFEYAIGHWLQKATEHMIGCVLCSPGCFSLFRAEALMSPNVMKRYTTEPKEARHYVQYDQGEDRWLCTLMLQQGWRVEYCAASDSFTNAPTGFDEFYNQRRRWVPSTMANVLDLLGDYKHTVKVNPNISTPYIIYQAIMMGGSILGPGTIFLMLVGAFVAAFGVDNYTSFYINVIPILSFIIICYYCDSKIQLAFARLLSVIYALVMVAVLVALALQIAQDGPLAPSSIFLVAVALSFIISALLHPLEFDCLIHGIVYYITIPSMYLLLIIYSLFNLNNVSWGTRENPAQAAEQKQQQQQVAASTAQAKPNKNRLGFLQDVIPGLDKAKNNSEGSMEFSCAGLFKLMCCVTEKPKDETPAILKKIHDEMTRQNKDLEAIKKTLNPAMDTRRGSVSSSLSTTITTTLPRNVLTSTSSGAFTAQQLVSVEEENEPETNEDEDDEAFKVKRDDLINPYWADDALLNHGERDFLTGKELKFWEKFIKMYLKPIDDTDPEEKKKQKKVKEELLALRDTSVGAFFMLNAVFVTALFLLQLNKDTIYIEWPLGGTHNFTYDPATDDIQLQTKYLQLEPLGLLFVVFFAIIIVVQFVGMLFHRFSTYSQIMAATTVGLFSANRDKDNFTRDVLNYIRKAGKLRNAAPEDPIEVDGAMRTTRGKSIVGNLLLRTETKPKVMTMDKVFITQFEKTAKGILSDKTDRSRGKSVAFPGESQFLGALVTRRNTVVERRKSVVERRNSTLDGSGQNRGSTFVNGQPARRSTVFRDGGEGERNSQV